MMQNITKLGQFAIKHMTGQTSGGNGDAAGDDVPF